MVLFALLSQKSFDSTSMMSHVTIPYRYLVINNISKRNNINILVNAAVVYKFDVVFVNEKSIDLSIYENKYSNTQFIKINSLQELSTYLAERNVPLFGIEIMENARSVLDEPFNESIAIMPGHEGDGLSKTQKQACQSFVYIPQYGNGTASLNVYIATTIILHKYSLWSTKQVL